MKRRHVIGMTLVELMAVVAIIALLAGIMVYFVSGNREMNAQKDLSNDVADLFQKQRMRSMTMNVATYIVFVGGTSVSSIEPRIGGSSICTSTETERYPIRYSSTNDDNVAIDIKTNMGKTRTMDSLTSNKYIHNGDELVVASATLRGPNDNVLNGGNNADLTMCFQPNGQMVFFVAKDIIQASAINVDITQPEIDDLHYMVEATGLGSIRSFKIAD